MTAAQTTAPLQAIADRARITADDVLTVRRKIFSDGHVARCEAAWLFRLEEAAAETCPEWRMLFVEALVDMCVRQAQPEGYVDAQTSQWLIARIGRDGAVATATELEAVIRIMELARDCPPALSAFALTCVKQAVLEGSDIARCGRPLTPGVINEPEVELIRRVLYAATSPGHIAVTREEAEVLFDINDSTVEAENHPAWSDLFAKAVANHLMFVSGYAPPPREEALRREKWLDEPASREGFMSRMVAGGLKAVWKGAFACADEDLLTRRNAEAGMHADAERVDNGEAAWLAARIGRDGVLHENEKAVLRFLQEESPHIHPALQGLIARAA